MCVISQSLCVSAVFDKLDQAGGRKIKQVQAVKVCNIDMCFL